MGVGGRWGGGGVTPAVGQELPSRGKRTRAREGDADHVAAREGDGEALDLDGRRALDRWLLRLERADDRPRDAHLGEGLDGRRDVVALDEDVPLGTQGLYRRRGSSELVCVREAPTRESASPLGRPPPPRAHTSHCAGVISRICLGGRQSVRKASVYRMPSACSFAETRLEGAAGGEREGASQTGKHTLITARAPHLGTAIVAT